MSGAAVLRPFVEAELGKINTVRVACVTKFEQSPTGGAVVEARPCVYSKARQLPIIVRVPVVYPMSTSQKAGVAYPLSRGDYVVLLFNQESLDEWVTYGGDHDPHDIRVFDLSDAIAVPGIVPLSGELPSMSTPGTVLVGELSTSGLRLEVGPSGIKLGDGTANGDLLKIIWELIDLLLNATTTGGYTLDPGSLIDLALLKVRVDAIKGVP
tara:strand:+ start:1991 stop:2623 length:633 start_codon:yes stop_codon:yes gene_type:complete